MNAKRIIQIFILLVAFGPATVNARESYHHIHFRVPDTAAAAAWYAKYMAGEQININGFDAVRQSNGTLLVFSPGNRPGVDGKPYTGQVDGSAGTAVDHIGFSFDDLDAMMSVYRKDGVKILQDVKQVGDLFSYGFVEDPWGTKLEVMQDADLIGLHHIHVMSPTADEAINWYQARFGGDIQPFKNIPVLPAINYGDLWLIVQGTDKPLSGTQFRSIDHLGFGVGDIESAMARYRKNDVKIAAEIRPFGNLKIGFITSPEGVLIEVVGPATP